MKHTEGSCHKRRERSQTLFRQVIFPPSPAHELDHYQFSRHYLIAGVAKFQLVEEKDRAEGKATPLVGMLYRERNDRQKSQAAESTPVCQFSPEKCNISQLTALQ